MILFHPARIYVFLRYANRYCNFLLSPQDYAKIKHVSCFFFP